MRRPEPRTIDPLSRIAERTNARAGAVTAQEVRRTGHDLPRAVDPLPAIDDISVRDSLPPVEQRWYKKIVVIRGGVGVADGAWQLLKDSADALTWVQLALGGGAAAAPNSATYITQVANGSLTAEQALSGLATGLVKVTTGTGVLSAAAASDLPSGIDAAKLSGGAVSNTEFDRLDGVTSAIQTQLNGKANDTGDTFTGNVVLHSGADILIYSDGGTTLRARFDGATGSIEIFHGADITLYSDGSTPQLTIDGADGTIYLGNASAQTIRHGAGSPEGAVTAPVGSTYHRTDGGAGTSFYVKQSGAGNTGWVGK